MSRHVDTTRPEDAAPHSWVPFKGAKHRKPGEAVVGYSLTEYTAMCDVWSGNADTDRAWRPDVNSDHLNPYFYD